MAATIEMAGAVDARRDGLADRLDGAAHGADRPDFRDELDGHGT